jgi:hypothetical protein
MNQQVSKTGLPRARDREPSQQRGARWRTVMGEDSAAGSKVRFSALIPKRMSHERCVAILRRLLLRRIFETQRPRRSYAVVSQMSVSESCLGTTGFTTLRGSPIP